MNEELFGPHLTIDGKRCDAGALTNRQLVADVLRELPARLDMTKMMEPVVMDWVDKFGTVPGFSGFVMIAESHISVHTFPDQDYVFIDIFSCRPFDVSAAIEYLSQVFGMKELETNVVERGKDFQRRCVITH